MATMRAWMDCESKMVTGGWDTSMMGGFESLGHGRLMEFVALTILALGDIVYVTMHDGR